MAAGGCVTLGPAPALAQASADREAFQNRRSGLLQTLEYQQRWLDESRRCVQVAKNSEALETCRRQGLVGGSGYGPMGTHMRGWGTGWGCPMW